MARSPLTRGDAAKPHIGVFRPATLLRSCFHTISPVSGFSRMNHPVAPVTYSPPSAGVGIITNDCFHWPALFLRKEQLACDRKRRPGRPDPGSPQLLGRMRRPIRRDAGAE